MPVALKSCPHDGTSAISRRTKLIMNFPGPAHIILRTFRCYSEGKLPYSLEHYSRRGKSLSCDLAAADESFSKHILPFYLPATDPESQPIPAASRHLSSQARPKSRAALLSPSPARMPDQPPPRRQRPDGPAHGRRGKKA
jgi:hypothetical protein